MLKGIVTLKTHEQLEREAIQAVRGILSFLPIKEPILTGRGYDPGYDFTITLDEALLVFEVKAHLWPNQVPAVAYGLQKHCRTSTEAPCVPVVVAPTISAQAAELCHELGLSWVDLAGNCHIEFGNVLVHIEGRKGERAPTRGTASLYTPRAARIVHALLLEPQRSWKVAELAERVQVSLGQVSNVRKLLVQNAFAEAGEGGIRLSEPRRLLSDWARNYRPRRTVRRYYSLRRPGELERSLGSHLPSYALTELAAADRYAPYARYQSVALYVTDWHSDYEKTLDLRPAESTPNVTVYEEPEGLLFSETQGEVSLASPIVTYLDLTLLGGRGQDAADHLLETAILPRWS